MTLAHPEAPVRRQLTCRDGRKLLARRLADGDQEALRRFDESLSERSRELFLPHQYDPDTLNRVIARSTAGDDLVYGLFDQENLVAYFFLWYARRRVCLLGIGITDDDQGQGLGRQLMTMLIEAGEALGVEGVELTTALDNDRAFALYRKMGFEYLRDVENVVGDGSIKIERCLFLPLQDGAEPMTEQHAPPV